MADLFGGLGGLMKGLSGLMPADDPKTQLFQLQSEVSDLKKQETDLYTQIGRQAVAQYGLEAFDAFADRLKLTQANLAAAEEKLQAANAEQEQREAAARAAREARTCPQCGHENPGGTKFCQECGGKLGQTGKACPACGHQNPPGTKFCQECGERLETEPAPLLCPACGQQNPPDTRFCGNCGERLGE